ncbi:MAG: hypothetical protein IJW31_09955 [Lentisphaeria bacterium]|nr:hypothetical protein [Lentisphaeria bacterium]
MKRGLQGKYETISTVGEKVKAFPIFNVANLKELTGLTNATIGNAFDRLLELDPIERITDNKHNRLLGYNRCINMYWYK